MGAKPRSSPLRGLNDTLPRNHRTPFLRNWECGEGTSFRDHPCGWKHLPTLLTQFRSRRGERASSVGPCIGKDIGRE